MALNTDQRFLGGGRLYFERLENGVLQAKQEIGEVKDFKVTSNISTTACEALDGDTPDIVDEVVVQQDFQISFTTNQVDKDTLLLALFGEVTTKQYNAGDTLPDGSTAQGGETYNIIDAGLAETVEGRVTFITYPKRGKKKVVVFNKVALQSNGDLILQSKEFVTLPFSGKVLKDSSVTEGSPYFRIYEES